MKRITILTFCFLATLVCVGQIKDAHDTLSIWTFGYPSSSLYQYTKLAPKYHFKLIYIGGCTISQDRISAALKHNKMADSLLDIINGKDWRGKYESEVNQTYHQDSIIISKIKSAPFIQEQIAIQTRNNNGFVYCVDSFLSNDLYRVQVYGYLSDLDASYGSYYRVIIRLSDLEIISIDDKRIPEWKP